MSVKRLYSSELCAQNCSAYLYKVLPDLQMKSIPGLLPFNADFIWTGVHGLY